MRRRRRSAADGRADITRLYRNPAQLRVLARVVPRATDGPLGVLLYGVADGAEAVSVLATLVHRGDAEVDLVGRDVDDALLEAARTGSYLAAEAPDGLPPEAEAVLAPRAGGGWSVRPAWSSSLRYEHGDVHDAGADGRGDRHLVLCQNTLVLFDPRTIPPVVAGLATHLRPGGVLALGGGPLDHVPAAAAAAGLEPITDDARAVHEGWKVQRAFWDNVVRPAWALEPYDATHPDAPVRYATLFRRPSS